MSDLEQFYNEEFKECWITPFEELTDRDKRIVKGSLSFACWQFRRAQDDLVQAIKKDLNRIKQLIGFSRPKGS
jgi:hypothetical protein